MYTRKTDRRVGVVSRLFVQVHRHDKSSVLKKRELVNVYYSPEFMTHISVGDRRVRIKAYSVVYDTSKKRKYTSQPHTLLPVGVLIMLYHNYNSPSVTINTYFNARFLVEPTTLQHSTYKMITLPATFICDLHTHTEVKSAMWRK